jgi:HTH-type transcriptional regulator/antitoxin HigA
MEATVIKTDSGHQSALAEMERLMDAPETPANLERMELLAILIEDYEKTRFPIPYPDPIEAIKFRMEQAGLAQKDLVPYLGSASKVSEVLNGKRSLSLTMIRALSAGLGIPAEVLLRKPGKRSSVKSPAISRARLQPQHG